MARKIAFQKLPSNTAKNFEVNYTLNVAKDRSLSNLETHTIVFNMVYNKNLSCINVATLLNMNVDEIKTNIKKAVQRHRDNIEAC